MSNRRLWVLGNGQLGAMLRHAGVPLGLEVVPVDVDGEVLPILAASDVVTAEREYWPVNAITRRLLEHPHFKNRQALALLSDRCEEKRCLDRLQLATAHWRELDATISEAQLFAELGEQVLLKRREGGYDGKGQQWLRRESGDKITAAWRGHAIAEQRVAFDDEVSLIGVRDEAGRSVFYPLTLNLHDDGILLASIAPLTRLAHLQGRAEVMLRRLMDALDYVGVVTMECFRVGDSLLVNEVAPRVHNSGHWTLAGCSQSQFESHIRAVMGLPVAAPVTKAATVMINLIGVEWDPRWLAVPTAEVYWYNKKVMPGRKLGHINLCYATPALLNESLQMLAQWLPARYEKAFAWVEQQFATPCCAQLGKL